MKSRGKHTADHVPDAVVRRGLTIKRSSGTPGLISMQPLMRREATSRQGATIRSREMK